MNTQHDTTAGSVSAFVPTETIFFDLGKAVVDSPLLCSVGVASGEATSPFLLTERTTTTIFHSDRRLADQVRERIEIAIARIRALSQLKDDWDGDGSKAIPPEVIERSIVFLTRAIELFSEPGTPLPPTPSVGPAPEGSLDIVWESTTFRMLINLAEVGNATYFGEDFLGATYKGSFRPEAPLKRILRLL